MNDINETRLPVKALRRTIDESIFTFETTDEVPELQSIIGQKRGQSVMEFGLQVNKLGYNIFVAGISGTGKMTFTESIVNDFANENKQLFDWCYVNNFIDHSKPNVLKLRAGMGKRLKDDMEKLVEHLTIDIPRVFRDESYQREKNAVIREHKRKTNEVIERMNKIAKGYGFIIQQSDGNMFTVPLLNDKPMTEEEYSHLSEEDLQLIEKNSEIIQEQMIDYSKELRQIEHEMRKGIEALDKKSVLLAISFNIDELKQRYKSSVNVIDYLKAVQEDILKHHTSFIKTTNNNDGNMANSRLAYVQAQQKRDVKKRYKINLIVDHELTEGAPVVVADNPTFYHLMGKVEYETEMGVMRTNYMKIKSGYLHEANGGYLIIQVKDILMKPYAWDSLKRALLTEYIHIEHMNEHAGVTSTTSLNPHPIPLQVKVVLVGSRQLYELLYAQDEDFRKLFKMRADFDVHMDATHENMVKLASFIHTHSKENDLLPFHRSAVARLVEYSMRLSGHQEKLSTKFNDQVEIIYEADAWATISNDSVVTDNHIRKAIVEREYRNNLYEEKIQESIDEGSILIDVEGRKKGQVNGLAVYNLGQYRFGKPSRITATTFLGRKGIVNIERESKLSGNVHNKGVYILSGYLGETFAQNYPLSLTAHLTFEQNYGGVDGDSTSSAELYTLLSSLSDVPLKQGIAVTGSVNQKGFIQPIGGVNEKVEGFFNTCQTRGLTGEQGVIIPKQNVKQLMLKEDVVRAIEKGLFHLYAIETIEQGIEILTDVRAVTYNEDKTYTTECVYGQVAEKLYQYFEVGKQDRTSD